jgi:hypothetical protein
MGSILLDPPARDLETSSYGCTTQHPTQIRPLPKPAGSLTTGKPAMDASMKSMPETSRPPTARRAAKLASPTVVAVPEGRRYEHTRTREASAPPPGSHAVAPNASTTCHRLMRPSPPREWRRVPAVAWASPNDALQQCRGGGEANGRGWEARAKLPVGQGRAAALP